MEAIFRNSILETPGILELTRLDFGFDAPTRSLSLSFDATTISGNINFSEVLEVV